jgi:hypothetical protein
MRQEPNRPALPTWASNVAEFGKWIGWGTGHEAARERARTITREFLMSPPFSIEQATGLGSVLSQGR